jgi:carbonyl reductase 1
MIGDYGGEQVNNAGANMFELTHEGTVLVMETNYYGVKKVIKGLLPILRASPAGARIVNVSSRAGRMRVSKNSLFIFIRMEYAFLL